MEGGLLGNFGVCVSEQRPRNPSAGGEADSTLRAASNACKRYGRADHKRDPYQIHGEFGSATIGEVPRMGASVQYNTNSIALIKFHQRLIKNHHKYNVNKLPGDKYPV